MNLSCPNQINGHCEKLDKPCHLVQEGCVLEGKVKIMGEQEQTDKDDEDGFFEIRFIVQDVDGLVSDLK